MIGILSVIGTFVLVCFVIREGTYLWREINNKDKDEW